MKVDILFQKAKHVTEEGSANIELDVQFFDGQNNPKENQQVIVKESGEVVFDTDTGPDGRALIEIVVNIVTETRRKLLFVVGDESREKVVVIDQSLPEIQVAMKRLVSIQRFNELFQDPDEDGIEKFDAVYGTVYPKLVVMLRERWSKTLELRGEKIKADELVRQKEEEEVKKLIPIQRCNELMRKSDLTKEDVEEYDVRFGDTQKRLVEKLREQLKIVQERQRQEEEQRQREFERQKQEEKEAQKRKIYLEQQATEIENRRREREAQNEVALIIVSKNGSLHFINKPFYYNVQGEKICTHSNLQVSEIRGELHYFTSPGMIFGSKYISRNFNIGLNCKLPYEYKRGKEELIRGKKRVYITVYGFSLNDGRRYSFEVSQKFEIQVNEDSKDITHLTCVKFH